MPQKQQETVGAERKAIVYQDSRAQAEQELAACIAKDEPLSPRAGACLRRDVEACLTFYDVPKEHWRYVRTTNIIERLVGEVKRRSHKMAAAVRNENRCLLLVYAGIRSLQFRNIAMPTRETTPKFLHNS